MAAAGLRFDNSRYPKLSITITNFLNYLNLKFYKIFISIACADR